MTCTAHATTAATAATVTAGEVRAGDVLRLDDAEHLVVRRAVIDGDAPEVMIETWTRNAHQHTVTFYPHAQPLELQLSA